MNGVFSNEISFWSLNRWQKLEMYSYEYILVTKSVAKSMTKKKKSATISFMATFEYINLPAYTQYLNI